MLSKEVESRQAVEMLCADMLVPQDYLLRKIDRAVDFRKIYEFVEDLYCLDNGRPSVDPVVLFKMVLIQHLFGIRSLRQTTFLRTSSTPTRHAASSFRLRERVSRSAPRRLRERRFVSAI